MSYKEIQENIRDLESVSIRGRLNIEDLVRRQIDRCNMALGGPDQLMFESYVRGLMSMLPIHKRDEIYENEDEFNEEIEEYVYEHSCGMQIGTPESPVLVYGPDDPEYDPKKPIIYSPKLVRRIETDYEKLYELTLTALQEVGLTWEVEHKTYEAAPASPPKSKVDIKLIHRVEDSIVELLLDAREETPKLTFHMIVERLRDRTPPTPLQRRHIDNGHP